MNEVCALCVRNVLGLVCINFYMGGQPAEVRLGFRLGWEASDVVAD